MCFYGLLSTDIMEGKYIQLEWSLKEVNISHITKSLNSTLSKIENMVVP